MTYYIQLFWRIFSRQESPENIPAEKSLFYFVIGILFTLNLITLLLVSQQILAGLVVSIVDIVVLALFLHLLLRTKDFEARFAQTFIAVMAVNIVFFVITLPARIYTVNNMQAYIEAMQNQMQPNNTALLFLSGVFVFVFFIKTFLAMIRIFSLALEVSNLQAFAYCAIYFFISLIVNNSVLSIFISDTAAVS